MEKEEVFALISAIMILIAMPSYFLYISNSRKYAEKDNITGFADDTTDIIVNEVKGEIVGAIIGIVVIMVFGFVALLKGSGLI